MGPTTGPLELFLISFPGGIVPAKTCAVISAMFRRRGFQTARLHFQQIRKTNKIADIVTGHDFCKTPPVDIILLGTVLQLKRL